MLHHATSAQAVLLLRLVGLHRNTHTSISVRLRKELDGAWCVRGAVKFES